VSGGEGNSPAGAGSSSEERSKNEYFFSLPFSSYNGGAQVSQKRYQLSQKRENNRAKSHKKGTNYHKKGKVSDWRGPSITEKGNYHKKQHA
jgi:hypothetical protein